MNPINSDPVLQLAQEYIANDPLFPIAELEADKTIQPRAKKVAQNQRDIIMREFTETESLNNTDQQIIAEDYMKT